VSSSRIMSTTKPVPYPICIHVDVTQCDRLEEEDANWSFRVQIHSNITSWDIQRTLSEIEQLDSQLRSCQELQSIKLPRSVCRLPSNKIAENGQQIIENYLWKLLRRAYIFISPPIQSFMGVPLIMEPKLALLSQQLQTILREDNILYAINSPSDKERYSNIRCVLRYGYVIDAYKIRNVQDIELKEGVHIHHETEFRIDVVDIKRVVRYQKECRFAVEIRSGRLYLFKCHTLQQFDQWVNDIKHMIKAQDGYSPYLQRWEDTGIENDHSLEEKVIEKMDDEELDDGLENGVLSNFTLSMHKIIPPITEEKHTEYLSTNSVDRVDLDIESCIRSVSSVSSETNEHRLLSDHNDDILEQEFMCITQRREQQHENSNERVLSPLQACKLAEQQISVIQEIKEDDDDDDRIHEPLKHDTIIKNESRSDSRSHSSSRAQQEDDDDDEEEDKDDFYDYDFEKDHKQTEQRQTYDIDDEDVDPITLKMEQEKLVNKRRKAMIKMQTQHMLRSHRERHRGALRRANSTVTYSAEKSSIMEYNNDGRREKGRVQSESNLLEAHSRTVSMEEFDAIKKQLTAWQSKAHRWQDLANLHERSHEEIEQKLQHKESKYRAKIRDQQNEILTLSKLLKRRETELEAKIIELRQLETTSNLTIQQLLTYKHTNEMRKKNSYIDGTLWKFAGDGMNNIKFNKAPKLKYVMYVPTRKKLYYSDSQHDDAETKLVNVTHITHKNHDIVHHMPDKYKNAWIKIIGQNRIVLFAAQSEQDANRWYETIKNSLQQPQNGHALDNDLF